MSSDCDDATNIPSEVAPEEELARSVFSQKHVRAVKGQPHKVLPKAFEPPPDRENPAQRITDISVDRFGYLDMDTAVRLAEARGKRRTSPVNFYGWAIILAQDASQEGREVAASFSSVEQNPAHADIKLPASTAYDADDRNFHMFGLAEKSCWLPRGCRQNSERVVNCR
jgi:hypothetical protein